MVKVLVMLLALIVLLFITGCAETHPTPTTAIGTLQEVEIRDYEGERLSSVDDFRENSIKGPQYIDIDSYSLKIKGLVSEEKEYSYEDIINNYTSYSKVVSLNCVEGWSVKILWEGLLVRDLLDEMEISPEANTVIFYAYDGYSSAYPLEYFYDNDIILAYKQNNATLMPERGFPFQLVAESKWGYKWVKWVTEIEISDDPEYRGYWESRGYAKEGNLDESFFKR